jgi:hypothetical protein
MSEIDKKYNELGGGQGFLGQPTEPEHGAPDGQGRYRHYQNGSIYWHQQSGAHEVHGSIREKWRTLGWEAGLLRYPVTDETATPDGVGRFNHFQGGSIYWHPETGAHEVHGDIRTCWAGLGWERGGLGFPVSDERNAAGGGRSSDFQRGSIRWRFHDVPDLSFFAQNMALLPWPFYKGKGRDHALAALIEKLRLERPDVVGLSECFVDGERRRIKDALGDIYHWSMGGPDEGDLESDGGLLLLSKHQVVEKHQTIYRQCKGADCVSNKGVLHARIQAAGHPTQYDIFLSHTQNPNEGGKETARAQVKAQLSHLYSFIQACRDPAQPALLVGDLNTDGNQPDIYADFMSRLGFPQDLWVVTGDHGRWPLGITSDDYAAFSKRSRSLDDPERYKKGSRIDYFLSWPGERFWPGHAGTEVVVWQWGDGWDISDHYGLKTRMTSLRELDVTIERPIAHVTVALSRFHCLEETNEAGSDEVYFWISGHTANGRDEKKKTSVKGNVDTGEVHSYPSPTTLNFGDPGEWLEVTVNGREEDGWGNADDNMGTVKIRLTRAELLAMSSQPTPRALPLLTGDGGEYAVTVTIGVE